MKMKKGITISILVITIIVMAILASVIIVSTSSSISYSMLVAWLTEIGYIQDTVDEYSHTSSALPYTSDIVTIDISKLSNEQIADQFPGETIINNIVSLNILNLGNLKITNTTYGNLETPNDVYAYSTTTGRVYYVEGLEMEGYTYYGITQSLKDSYNLAPANGELSSVVFVPNVIGYTNKPITVTVKLPKSYTNISITTSSVDVIVGPQTVVENTYVYNVNTNNVGGNYTITVSYKSGSQSYTTTYSVNSYDVTPPVISSISNENFSIVDVTANSILAYLTNISATDTSGIKHLKYTLGTVTKENAKAYFQTAGNNLVGGKINLDNTSNEYTIYAEDNAGNYNVISFSKLDYMNVVAVVDSVPIPRGFVASKATGENTKDGGLVIYEGTEDVTDANVQQAKRERNQYVWIPVADLSTNKFERVNWHEGVEGYEWITLSNQLGTGFWEVTPNIKDAGDFVTQQTIDEVTEMYESVEKYGGFYIARYEAGIEKQRTSGSEEITTTIYSQMNKIPYNYIGWSNSITMTVETGGAVEVARCVYPKTNTSYGVVSTLTYAVQWDAVVQWLKDNGVNILDSTEYGNYKNNEILNSSFNEGASVSKDSGKNYIAIDLTYAKSNNEYHLFTTGATEEARVKNLYDIAGNLLEWTMEGYIPGYRVSCGGYFLGGGVSYPISYRYVGDHQGIPHDNRGFRSTLYIKK